MNRRIVFWLLLGLTVLVAILGLYRWFETRQATARRVAEQSQPALTGAPRSIAPDLELVGLDGARVSLKDLRGKVVLLNFWATWCPPCTAEMPDLEALYREYGDAQDFVVAGVNFEEEVEPVDRFVREHKISFPVWLDSKGEAGAQLGVRGLPVSFIVDREGYIRDAWNGQIAREAMLARLKRIW